MLEDHNKLLYPNCEDGQKKLCTTLAFVQLKAANGTSDKGFEKLLKIIKKMLPGENVLPSSTYEAKKVVCPLGLEVQKIRGIRLEMPDWNPWCFGLLLGIWGLHPQH